MEPNTNGKIKHMAAIGAATVFMGAAYYLPAETFLSFFAAGLFMIPATFFVYMLQKVKGDDIEGIKGE